MTSPLKPEFDYYLEHQEEIVRQYRGQYVVIKGRRVIGAYADEQSAISETAKTEPLGTFLVQQAEPGSGTYSQTFHSRAAFSR